MKIVIGGSMAFAKEQIKIKKELEEKGHEILITDNIEEYANNPEIKKDFEEEVRISVRDNIMMTFFKKIEESDGFLICNYDKKGVKGYLGTNALMEMGVAYYLGKKIFLLQESDKSQSYAVEVSIMNPTILNRDLSKIK